MAAKGTYSDPTMVAFEGLYVPENGDLSPAYAPFRRHDAAGDRARSSAPAASRCRRT